MSKEEKDLSIYWIRQDLRIADNLALTKASEGNFLAIYIYDNINCGKYSEIGEASRWWLYHSLKSLNKSMNGKICFYEGDPQTILSDLNDQYKIRNIYWNRCYEPWKIARDRNIKENFRKKGINVETFNASLLWEPWEIYKDDKTPYMVFTPFFKKGCLNAPSPRYPAVKPDLDRLVKSRSSLSIDQISLMPEIKWYKKFNSLWEIGEEAAYKKLKKFIDNGLFDYKEGRNFPNKSNVSRLSPHLHFGEISPNQVWHQIEEIDNTNYSEKDLYHFKSEIGWREFSYSLLYYNQDLQQENLYKKFDKFPWAFNEVNLKKWQEGLTGYPIVDAGMRELWQTGYMHNRLRMIVGSFLVKNLLIHWNHGERWFWDCLVDADMASNSAGWQWVAGSGADASPYFRIFNPIMQGQKFDPDGTYTKKYIPELEKLPLKYLFNPWEAPSEVLSKAGIKIGKDYPEPIVNMQKSRELALLAFDQIRVK